MTVALVTDTTADLPASTAGVRVVPARVAFADHNFRDNEIAAADFYTRLREAGSARPSAPTEDEFRDVFEAELAAHDSVVCLVAPFDMVPTFTAANAAAVTLKPQPVKIVNPGVASAGLGCLLLGLAAGASAGWTAEQILDAVDDLAPGCDSLFVPGSVEWLDRSGRLALIEDKLGTFDEGCPVVRAGTRITGVALSDSKERAIDEIVERGGQRAGGKDLVINVVHAGDPDTAARLADRMIERWKVASSAVTDLSPTYGSQLGPGAIGVGVAPAVHL